MYKNYKIALGEKFLLKDDNKWIAKIKSRFTSLGKTYDQLFRMYMEDINYDIHITPKTKEKRIL